MPPSDESAHSSLRLTGLRDAIPRCEGKLKELKILYEQSVNKPEKPCDYQIQASIQALCRNLAQDICEDIMNGLEQHVVVEFTKDVAQEQSEQNDRQQTPEMREVLASAEGPKEDSVIYVKGVDEQTVYRKVRRGGRRRTLHNQGNKPTLRTSPHRQSASSAFVKPVPNEVYVAYWPMSKSWFAVLVLPFEDIEKFGLTESILACYDCNKHTGQVGWKKGYEDDGPLAADREFPVMFFEGARVLDKGALGWVAAKDLQVFDFEGSQASLIPYYDSVRTFIRNRHVPRTDDAFAGYHHAAHETQEDGDNGSQSDEAPMPTSALSSAENTTEPSHERESRSRRSTAVDSAPTGRFSLSEGQSATEEATVTEKMPTAVDTVSGMQPHPIDCAQNTELSGGSASQITTVGVSLPASIYLTKPIRVSMSGNSPTSYDLPPLTAVTSHMAPSLPNLRAVLGSASTSPHRSTMTTDRGVRTNAAHRKMAPERRPVIKWPSLSKPRYRPQRTRPADWRSPVLPSSLGRYVGGMRSGAGQPRHENPLKRELMQVCPFCLKGYRHLGRHLDRHRLDAAMRKENRQE
ncbi:hypothetical protein B0J13DRAFT_565824 [Dactylonectria estremocensis]|uniref:Uncharacterized protein n=1 Tax=Dactylonectria estremocensis TaxID=1079267 RepID=A0A9P9DUS0_9HYPO|nr:hypothetical protein B0J13DRAFT_565824 [Dactylonectria estremocensis]